MSGASEISFGMSGFVGTFAVLIVLAVVAVERGMKLRVGKGSKWGINFTRMKCPDCDASLPIFRTPQNFKQALWGGFTCRQCGKELDKWLKPIP